MRLPRYGRVAGSIIKPLIVTPTFVSRTNATPEDERPHDGASGVNRTGQEVAPPDRHTSALALEPDPDRVFERWDEHCRNVSERPAEAAFADPEASEFWTAVNYSVADCLMLELATER